MAIVVSASRRTDIPAFFADWFWERLDAGFVEVANPWNNRQVRCVSLLPSDVACFVFWTRDARPFLQYIERLASYAFYFHVTITGYGPPLEPASPCLEEAVAALRELAARVGASRVIWRYDPVVLAGKYNVAWHLENFERLSRQIEGFAASCVVSFYDHYRHSDRRLAKEGLVVPDGIAASGAARELVLRCAESAQRADMALSVCAEPELAAIPGLTPRACIDAYLISGLTTQPFSARKDKNQRLTCQCIESIDIGRYRTCQRGCLYCYANR